MGIAYNVNLVFKFDDKALETKFGEMLKNFSVDPISELEADSPETFHTTLLKIFPEHSEAVEKFTKQEDKYDLIYRDLFEGIEHVSLHTAKTSVATVGYGEIEEYVKRFIYFIREVGGKPLTCSIDSDEGCLFAKYKMLKSGELKETYLDAGI